MTISIAPASAAELLAAADQVAQVYQATFAEAPFHEQQADFQRFAVSLIAHANRSGFQACLAQDPHTHQVLGFSYGYTSQAGQWWHDTVAARLQAHEVRRWFTHCFEIVTLAVPPSLQGQGIGGRLHDGLLAHIPHQTAVLSTFQEETAARQLYRSRGWQTIREGFVFPGGTRPFVVLGRTLLPSIEAAATAYVSEE